MASGKPLSEPTEIFSIFGNQNIANSLSTVNINTPSSLGFYSLPPRLML